MQADTKTAVMKRLSRVEGQVRGLSRMVEDDRYCIDVIKQIQAAQTALSRVSENILDSHLHTCVTTAMRGDDPDDRERVLNEITEVFRQTNKP